MRWKACRLPGCVIIVTALAVACGGTPSGTLPDPSDPEALLTDEQLITPADPLAAEVDPAWEQWVRANRVVIRSLTSRRTDDLQFMKPLIGGRRIVQLGESGHDVREFNLAKLRLIRFLHEELGFNVLAFESGFFECWQADRAGYAALDVAMRSCVYSTWHTEEVLALFAYLRQRRASGRPLVLAGIDVQLTSIPTAREHAPRVLRDVVARIDARFAARIAELDSIFYIEFPTTVAAAGPDRRHRSEVVRALDQRHGFSAAYDSVVAIIDAHAGALAAAFPSDPQLPLVARQTAWSRAQFLAAEQTSTFNAFFNIRDASMARNVEFLLDRLYPQEKVIVWAHNAHVMHDRASATRLNSTAPLPQSMGAHLAARRRQDLYTIGLFMYAGLTTFPVGRPLPGSLEAILERARLEWIFVDLLRQSPSAGTSWMFQNVHAKEWGTTDYLLTPRAQFDGVLFLHTVSRARFLPVPGGL